MTKPVAVIAHRLLAQREHVGDVTHAHLPGQGEEDVDTPDQAQRAMGVGLLQTTLELRARAGPEV